MNKILMVAAVILLTLAALGIALGSVHLGWLGLALWAATSLTDGL